MGNVKFALGGRSTKPCLGRQQTADKDRRVARQLATETGVEIPGMGSSAEPVRRFQTRHVWQRGSRNVWCCAVRPGTSPLDWALASAPTIGSGGVPPGSRAVPTARVMR
jgi:hypothetical protein